MWLAATVLDINVMIVCCYVYHFTSFQNTCSLRVLSGPVASNNLRLRGGFEGDDVWRLLLGEGLLETSLSFGELARLGRLNRSSLRLHNAAWCAIWCARSQRCGGAELGRILRLAVILGKAVHVRKLLWPMGE